MIKMGMAKAYDFKIFLSILALLYLGLTAASVFGEKKAGAVQSSVPSPLGG